MSASAGRADGRPVVLMAKYPDETFTYSISLIGIMDGGSIDGLAVASAPSGAGELTLSELNADGPNAIVVVGGGQPGRIYTLKLGISLDTGDARELLATLTVGRVLITDQPGVPDTVDFGETLVWP